MEKKEEKTYKTPGFIVFGQKRPALASFRQRLCNFSPPIVKILNSWGSSELFPRFPSKNLERGERPVGGRQITELEFLNNLWGLGTE
jgi:hypothetical protein